ncbi:MFS transporter [Cohnella thailandensis]|uniref:MFS transporter n=1 Tax=Cohnella thailandensis TaxID=557557 RepID=A0A841SSL3_9BACL|nr:MFS transporter [Cohnella thailandensis]MBB6633045.1 MFS transporter [Cohnella thailandensis]MBP1975260.1 putative MFS family arabinose efflux permease [Cohnella thailandensis]
MLRRNRSFAKMFASYGLSAFGDYFDLMAVSILLGFIWKADAMTVALVPISYAVPGILFGQFAGIAADWWNKRNLMIAADLIRAVLTVLLIFAPNPGVLLGLITLRAAVRVFHYPAQQAMTRSVVDAGQLLQATSLNGAVFQLSKILGPLLGASVATAVSPAGCMAVNSACYVLSALLLASVPARHGRVSKATAPLAGMAALRSAWSEGWRILLRSRTLLASVGFCLTGLAGIQLIDAQLAVLLREVAPDKPELIGWIVTAIGTGGLSGVAWLHRYKQLHAYGWLLGGGAALIGLMFAAAGMFRPEDPLWLLLLVFFVGGVGTGLTSTGMNYILQKETPPDAIGRVSGIFDSLSSAIFIVAPLAGGLLIGWRGAPGTFMTVGILVGFIGLTGIVLQRKLWKRVIYSND